MCLSTVYHGDLPVWCRNFRRTTRRWATRGTWLAAWGTASTRSSHRRTKGRSCRRWRWCVTSARGGIWRSASREDCGWGWREATPSGDTSAGRASSHGTIAYWRYWSTPSFCVRRTATAWRPPTRSLPDVRTRHMRTRERTAGATRGHRPIGPLQLLATWWQWGPIRRPGAHRCLYARA